MEVLSSHSSAASLALARKNTIGDKKESLEKRNIFNFTCFSIIIAIVGSCTSGILFMFSMPEAIRLQKHISGAVLNVTRDASRLNFYFHHYQLLLSVMVAAAEIISSLICLLAVYNKNIHHKIVYTQAVIVFMNLVFCIVTVSDSRTWPESAFWILVLCVSCVRALETFLTLIIFDFVGNFPGNEVAVFIGFAISLIIASLVTILSKLNVGYQQKYNIFELRSWALASCLANVIINCVCWVGYSSLTFNRNYRYYHRIKIFPTLDNTKKKTQIKDIFVETLHLQLSLLMLAFVSSCCFNIQKAIEPLIMCNFPKLYIDLVIKLNGGVSLLLGSLLTLKVKTSPKIVWIPVCFRVVLIPILIYCNYRPKIRQIAIYFYNDSVNGVIAFMLGFSDGFFAPLIFEYISYSCYENGFNPGLALKLSGTGLVLGRWLGHIVEFIISKIVASL